MLEKIFKYFSLFASIFVVSFAILLVIVIENSYNYRNKTAIKIQKVKIKSDVFPSQTLTIPFNRFFANNQEKELGLFMIEATFNYKKQQFKNPVLLIGAMDCNAFKVFINDYFIGYSGNTVTGNSSRWNHAEIFDIPSDIIKEGENRLKLEAVVLSVMEITTPIYISELKEAVPFIFRLNFVNNSVVLLGIGVMFLLGVLSIFLGIYLPKSQSRVFIGIAMIFLGLYLWDFVYLPQLPIAYALFKKFVISSFYSSIGFLIIGYSLEFKKLFKLSLGLGIVFFICSLFMIVLPLDTILIKKVYHILNYLVFLFLIDIVLIVALSLKESRNIFSFFQLYLLLFLIPFFSHDLIGVNSNTNIIVLTPQAMVIFYIALSSFLIYSFLDIYKQMVNERMHSKMMEKEVYRDELTGVFNRKIIKQIRDLIPISYSVALLDLDDFKGINDNYGHNVGDYVLIEVSNIIKYATRSTDYIIRYGGDEFIILLFDCDINRAKELLEELFKKIENHNYNYNNKKLINLVHCSVGLIGKGKYSDYRQLFEEVDTLMYEAKKRGKGQIVFS